MKARSITKRTETIYYTCKDVYLLKKVKEKIYFYIPSDDIWTFGGLCNSCQKISMQRAKQLFPNATL